MNHLAIKINGKYAVLPDDFSIDVEDVNPLFNDYESYSYDTELPIEKNRHIFGDLSNVKSDKRLVDYENGKMQIIVDGIPFRSGYIQTNENEEIDDSISISMVSSLQTLDDMVSDIQCQDVPVIDKIKIGEIIGNVYAKISFYWYLKWKSKGKTGFLTWSSSTATGGRTLDTIAQKFEVQALGFSLPASCDEDSDGYAKQSNGKPKIAESYINVSLPYPQAKYCNARVCYTHYKKESDGTSGSTVSTSDTYDPYYVLEADRPQSGICFYLLYFLDCLFSYLGYSFDNSKLTAVGDLCRVAFFTTHCKYDLERKNADKGDDNYDYTDLTQINKWLSSRNTKGSLKFEYDTVKSLDSVTIGGNLYKVGEEIPGLGDLKYAEFDVTDLKSEVKANVMNMYANSDNFPDVSVTSILDSMWASFGVKFLVDYEKKNVRAVLIRDIYRDKTAPIELHVRLINAYKISEKITGVRMKYSAESDKDEQQSNLKNGVKDYDTNYDYIDYSNVNSELTYLQIVKMSGSSDTICYIDKTTGNAYRLKVDADASTIDELKPAVFEVGAFKGVEIGDCSTQNEDFVEEIVSDFEPLILNDINGKKEKAVGEATDSYVKDPTTGNIFSLTAVNSENTKQILAAFVDEDMWHENMTMKVKNVMGDNYINAYLTETFETDECYDTTQTDDGNSPLQSTDWGLAITVMRGGGSDETIQYYDYDYDGCGNSKWRVVAGEYAISPDSIDNWASAYDYNGTQEGIGSEERFSLKIRAFKEVNGEILCDKDDTDRYGNVTHKVRSRGLYDTFMSEHAHFLLNRKKLQLEFYCNISELTDIQWERRYKIGDYIFWWNKISYNIDVKSGLGLVQAEVYLL